MINELFDVHMLNEDGKKKAVRLAEDFSELLERVSEVVPAGRELSIVKTHLQEAAFWAKRGMAVDKANQVGVLPAGGAGPINGG